MKKNDLVKVRFQNGMHGVFVSEPCTAGTIMTVLSTDKISDKPTKTSIHVGNEMHVEDPIGIYINHACTPTCRIKGTTVVSLMDLHAGDEVTFDYNSSEASISSPFVCRCCKSLIGVCPGCGCTPCDCGWGYDEKNI